MTLVFERATVLDCTGRDPQPQMRVQVEDGRILRISKADGSVMPRDARVIDCSGRFLMPGLLDAHVHLASIELDERKEAETPPAVLSLRIAQQIEEALDSGFTTVRDAGGLDWGFKEAVRLKLIRGPRLLISGPFISQTGGHADHRPRTLRPSSPWLSGWSRECIIADGRDDVRRAAREVLRRGGDQIKVMASGGAASPNDELDHVQYSVDELAAAVDVAQAACTYVLAHAYGPRSIKNCLKAGVRSIEHGNFLDEETADQMLASREVFLVPTIITYELLSRREAGNGWTEANVRKIRQALTGAYDSLGLAYEKGLRIGSGSDVLGGMQQGRGREVACHAQVMGAMAAIIASTRTNAELVRLEDEIGTVEEGKRADLIMLNGDPLADPGLFGDPQNVRMVVQDGRVVKDADDPLVGLAAAQ